MIDGEPNNHQRCPPGRLTPFRWICVIIERVGSAGTGEWLRGQIEHRMVAVEGQERSHEQPTRDGVAGGPARTIAQAARVLLAV
jgi:N6-adenosine-specific RNA methylase IME4